MVLLGLSDKEIGVDIEAEKEFKDSLINYVVTDKEKALAKELEQTLNLSLNQVYTRLWTAKESVMKYSGMGISLEPKKIHLFIREASRNMNSVLGATSEVFDCSALTLVCASITGYQFTTCSEYLSFNLSEI
jgi:4'-phosphopantetheinyl transferase